MWLPEEVISFCIDCIDHGIKAVSFGGGEPFEYVGIFDIIDALYDKCYLSVTTNGLPLENKEIWNSLMSHKPDKIHITIHQPDNKAEVERVLQQIVQLSQTKIKPGINLLVGKDKISAASATYKKLLEVITAEQIILVPQRFGNTPSPKQLAEVTDGKPFQSPSCLLKCRRPTQFVSVSWDKKVNSCSYAPGKQPLPTIDYKGLVFALSQVHWQSCTSH